MDIQPTASQRIPALALPFVSEKAKVAIDLVEKFVSEECLPADKLYVAQLDAQKSRWAEHPKIIDNLKARAKELGIWNMFLPKNHFANEGSPGFTNLEYGLMAEQLGKSRLASEACNCAAPDTGNMEVIARYGNSAQKDRWLKPLLAGEVRSAFLMTEPDIASSDGSNIRLKIERKSDHYLVNGSKWWASGAGDARCKVFVVMGMSDANNPDKYRRQSMLLVPASTPGIKLKRVLDVYGYDDAPHGHGHLTFTDVKVPLDSLLLGEGRGNEIMQGRLGPGRIHHCMRTIGVAEYALDWMISRLHDDRKIPFGKPLKEHGVLIEWVARSRINIDAARLIVLNAALMIDQGDAKYAMKEIAEAKITVPTMALEVIDRAVQAHGAMGVCDDTPLAWMWAQVRTLRIADGPDEAHLQQVGRRENRRHTVVQNTFSMRQAKEDQYFKDFPVGGAQKPKL